MGAQHHGGGRKIAVALRVPEDPTTATPDGVTTTLKFVVKDEAFVAAPPQIVVRGWGGCGRAGSRRGMNRSGGGCLSKSWQTNTKGRQGCGKQLVIGAMPERERL